MNLPVHFQLFDLLCSQYLILHPSLVIHLHGHTVWPCPYQESYCLQNLNYVSQCLTTPFYFILFCFSLVILCSFIFIYLCLPSPPHFLASSREVTTISDFAPLIPLILEMTLSHVYVFLNSMLFSYFLELYKNDVILHVVYWNLYFFKHHSINKISPCCCT